MTGFWGTPIANEKCRTADVILAIGTRLAEANSSSWDPRFTFNIPPTRLIHIDADVAEIGRNFPTELGVVADAKLALGGARDGRAGRQAPQPRLAARWRSRRAAARSPPTGPTSTARTSTRCARSASSASCAGACRRTATSSPTSAGTRTASASSSRSPCPARSSRRADWRRWDSGRRRRSASKLAQPDRAVVALIGDGAFGSNPSVVATAMEAELGVVWLVMDNAAFGTIAGLTNMHYGWEFGCLFEADGARYRTDFAQMARRLRRRRRAHPRRPTSSARRSARRSRPAGRP